jgi:hypothetical protein
LIIFSTFIVTEMKIWINNVYLKRTIKHNKQRNIYGATNELRIAYFNPSSWPGPKTEEYFLFPPSRVTNICNNQITEYTHISDALAKKIYYAS